MRPVFIGITRSFWLALATAALLLGQGEAMVLALATVLATLWSWLDALSGLAGLRLPAAQAAGLASWLTDTAPLITFLAALQQRSGAARPYTLRLTAASLS